MEAFSLLLVILLSCEANAQLKVCTDGGAGPCVGNMCPANNNQQCIQTAAGEVCCDNTKCPRFAVCKIEGLCIRCSGSQKCKILDYISGFIQDVPVTQAATTRTAPCVDKVNPKTGVPDCPKVAYLCNNPVYFQLMTQQCPKTCNRCTSTPVPQNPQSATCVDKVNPKTGVPDCPRVAYLCDNPVYFQLMTQQCPKTCNRCTSTPATQNPQSATCFDRVNPRTGVSDCPIRSYLCNNLVYYQLMTQQCPRTCNRCNQFTSNPVNPVTTANPNCFDRVNPKTGKSDCPARAYLCQVSAYVNLMKQQCPKTCRYC